MAATMKTAVSLISINVSAKHAVTIFRAEKQAARGKKITDTRKGGQGLELGTHH
jgi:hypothetical protein